MASVIYNSAILGLLTGQIDLDTDTLKVMLVTSAYTPNVDTHEFRDDVTGEVTGTGYTTGGETLTGVTVTVNTATDQITLNADDVTWEDATITARWAIVYKSLGGAASADRLLFAYDFVTDKSSSDSDFVIAWSASGLMVSEQA